MAPVPIARFEGLAEKVFPHNPQTGERITSSNLHEINTDRLATVWEHYPRLCALNIWLPDGLAGRIDNKSFAHAGGYVRFMEAEL